MTKKEELRLKLDRVLLEFEKGDYELSLIEINKSATFILKELNNYNRKH